MLTEKQKEKRKNGLGGSDIPIIFGISSYKTPYQLYLEKKGILTMDEKMSPTQYWGHKSENMIREEFSIRNNVRIDQYDTLIHPLYEFLLANIDGYIFEWNSILEIKCSTQFMSSQWGPSGTSFIPLPYILQVAHYCSVMNVDNAYIAVLIGGFDYREYHYIRDFQLEKIIIESASEFWQCIKNNVIPSPKNIKDLKIMYPQNKNLKSINISRDIELEVKNIKEIKNKIKELEKIEEENKFNIMKYMKDSEVLIDEEGNTLISWTCNKKGTRNFLIKGE